MLALSCGRDQKTGATAENTAQQQVIHFYTQAQEENRSLAERAALASKAFELGSTIEQDTTFSKVIYLKNWLSYSLGQYDSLLKYDRILIKHAQKINDTTILAMEYYIKGYYYDMVAQNPDSAFANYSLSKNYYLQLGDSSEVAKNLRNMGAIQARQSDFFGSKETLTEALKYLDSEKEKETSYSIINELARNHRKLLNYKEAINYYTDVIKKDTSSRQLIYLNNLATVYTDQKNYQKARSILDQVKQDSRFGQNEVQKARVLDNYAYASWLSGEKPEEDAFIIPLKLRKKNNDKEGQIASFTHLGEYYSQSQPQRAIAYFDTVVSLSKLQAMPKAELDVLKFRIEIDPQNIPIRDRYMFLNDSLLERQLKVKTQFAKYKYDNQLSEESILQLEKETAEKELELVEQRYYKLWFGAGLFLAIVLIVLLDFSQKQRTKRLKAQSRVESLEATYEAEASFSRKLHDDFGSGLNNVMLLVQGNGTKEEILDRVEGLYNQSRDFSRALNEIDTGLGYKDSFINMLRFQTPPAVNLILLGTQPVDWDNITNLGKITLYKILRELMINMQKHSEAKLVKISFTQKINELVVNYADNGVGASIEALNSKNGLRNTEKRIQAIGGTIIFESEKEKGFTAELHIPN